MTASIKNPAIRKTGTIKLILLTIFTLSIFWYVWLWKLITDINKLYPDKSKRIHRYNWFCALIGIHIISIILYLENIQTEYILNAAALIWLFVNLILTLQILKNIEDYIKDKFDIEIKHNTLGWLVFGSFYVNYKINRLNFSIQEGIDRKIIQIKLFNEEPKLITLLKNAQEKVISFFQCGKRNI